MKLPVVLASTGTSFRTETADISSGGFLCNLPEPFEPGEHLYCLITLNAGGAPLYLEGDAEVVRIVVENSQPGFRIGFRLDVYHVRKDLPAAQVARYGQARQLILPDGVQQTCLVS